MPAERVIFTPETALRTAGDRYRARTECVARETDGNTWYTKRVPGAPSGEIPVFSGGTYPATAIAAEPPLSGGATETIRATMQSDPGLAFTLLGALAAERGHWSNVWTGLPPRT